MRLPPSQLDYPMGFAAAPSTVEPDYPCSDGEPVGETEIHAEELMYFRELLRRRYRHVPDYYAGGNMFFYYEKGNVAACFCPDVFLVRGVSKRIRRVFKLWEEAAAPSFVLEVSSRKTWLEDAGNKKTLCARLGVEEYFLFDPEGDYLDPPLQGWRLRDGHYAAIEPEPDGSVCSDVLDMRLYPEPHPGRLWLRTVERSTGEVVLRIPEQLDEADDVLERCQRAEQAKTRAEQEKTRAEARAAEAEREVERLRRLLDAK